MRVPKIIKPCFQGLILLSYFTAALFLCTFGSTGTSLSFCLFYDLLRDFALSWFTCHFFLCNFCYFLFCSCHDVVSFRLLTMNKSNISIDKSTPLLGEFLIRFMMLLKNRLRCLSMTRDLLCVLLNDVIFSITFSQLNYR